MYARIGLSTEAGAQVAKHDVLCGSLNQTWTHQSRDGVTKSGKKWIQMQDVAGTEESIFIEDTGTKDMHAAKPNKTRPD